MNIETNLSFCWVNCTTRWHKPESLDDDKIVSTKDEAAESTMMEDETNEGKLKKIIRSTTDYLIQYDKKQLLELINEFGKDCGEDFLDIIQVLEELIDVYLLDEFLDGEPMMTKIDELRRKLDSSAIPKSKQHRLKYLLDVIAQNRHRVQTILTRMAGADGEDHLYFRLKQLAHDGLHSEEQYLELNKALLEDELDSSRIVDVIKGTKVG